MTPCWRCERCDEGLLYTTPLFSDDEIDMGNLRPFADKRFSNECMSKIDQSYTTSLGVYGVGIGSATEKGCGGVGCKKDAAPCMAKPPAIHPFPVDRSAGSSSLHLRELHQRGECYLGRDDDVLSMTGGPIRGLRDR